VVAGGTVGGAVGLGIGAASYLVINPLLEGTGTWIEELQGLAWNLVPAGAIFGIVAGVLIAAGLRTRL